MRYRKSIVLVNPFRAKIPLTLSQKTMNRLENPYLMLFLKMMFICGYHAPFVKYGGWYEKKTAKNSNFNSVFFHSLLETLRSIQSIA